MNLRYVLFLACTAATGGLLFGFDVAIISGAGPFLARHFELGDFGLGVAFSSLLFGCALGAAFAGRLSDRYGRRYVLLWIAVLFALTSVATAIAWDFPSFLAARFIGGLAVGAVSLVSPMYISEVAPAAVRGQAGRALPDVHRHGHPRVLLHQLSAARHRPGQLALDVRHRRDPVRDFLRVVVACPRNAAVPLHGRAPRRGARRHGADRRLAGRSVVGQLLRHRPRPAAHGRKCFSRACAAPCSSASGSPS